MVWAVCGPWQAQAAQATTPTWPLVGEGKFTFWGLSIYHAELRAPAPLTPERWAMQAFSLTLTYARTFSGEDIAQRSLKEMQRDPNMDRSRESAWLQQMQACIPNVVEGDAITGTYTPAQGIRFTHNGQTTCEVQDPAFAKQFMGIWLGTSTSEPTLRQALLGGTSRASAGS